MIDGIEVITKTEIVDSNDTFMFLALIIVVIMFIIIISCIFIDRFKNKIAEISFIVISVGSIVAFILVTLGVSVFAERTGRYQYVARINPSVSLTEFYEQYDNIHHVGDVYMFEDKH